MEDQFLTVTEVADLLGCSTRTVRRMIERGDVPAVKIGHLLRVEREDLEGSLVHFRGES